MRISTGKLKGLIIKPIKGIRPTQDKVKSAVFNILGSDMSGVKFLELYAGSGLVGFEALSRGAEEVIFIEKDPVCAKAIEETGAKVERHLAGRRLEVFRQDANTAIEKFHSRGQKFDVVFCDPPYFKEIRRDTACRVATPEIGAKKILQTLGRYDIMSDIGILVIQAHRKEILEEISGSLSLLRSYRYGDTKLLVYQKK
jgi:16S rRNA (guanine(966)-N(2))-methyltransferase RsmD